MKEKIKAVVGLLIVIVIENMKNIAIGLVIFFVLLTSYQAFVVVPREEIAFQKKQIEDKAFQEKMDEWQREANYNECIDTAETLYTENWNNACDIMGRKDDCLLPSSRADDAGALLKEEKNRCVTMYK